MWNSLLMCPGSTVACPWSSEFPFKGPEKTQSVVVLEMSFFMFLLLVLLAGGEGKCLSPSVALTGEGKMWFSDWADRNLQL